MKTLEKMVKKELETRGYILNPKYINLQAAAEYIDFRNEEDPTAYYTPKDWVDDTLEVYPMYFIPNLERMNVLDDTVLYLVQQRNMCIDQTGTSPEWEDYISALECEGYTLFLEQRELNPEYKVTKLEEVLEYLLEYWDRN